MKAQFETIRMFSNVLPFRLSVSWSVGQSLTEPSPPLFAIIIGME